MFGLRVFGASGASGATGAAGAMNERMIDVGNGPPLVLIPGLQGRWEWMRPTVNALARTFRVLSFTLAGDWGSRCAVRRAARVRQLHRADRSVLDDAGSRVGRLLRRVVRRADRGALRGASASSACGIWCWPRPCRRTIRSISGTTSTGGRRCCCCRCSRSHPPIARRRNFEPRCRRFGRACSMVPQALRVIAAPVSPAHMKRRMELIRTVDFSRRRPPGAGAGAGHHGRAGPGSHGARPAHAALPGVPARHRARRARSHGPHGHGDPPGRVRLHRRLVCLAHRAEPRRGARFPDGGLDGADSGVRPSWARGPARGAARRAGPARRHPAARRGRVRASAPAAGRDDAHQGGLPGHQGAVGHRLLGAAVQLSWRGHQRRARGTRRAASARTFAPASTTWPPATRAASCGPRGFPSAPGSR